MNNHGSEQLAMDNKYGGEQLASGKLNTTNAVTLLMGAMIGSAIFSLSGVTYASAGPAHILTWIVAAAIMLVYGLIIAELASIYPVVGGLFVYPRELFGKTENTKNFWGWFSAWAFLNPAIFGAAFSAIYVSTYLGSVVPAVSEHTIAWALIACALCGVLCILKISVTGKINMLLVIFVGVVLVAYSLKGFTAFDASNFTPFFAQGTEGTTGWLSSMPNALLAYGAVAALVSMTSEIKNPNKTIPRAMVISVTTTAALYVLSVIATVGMMNASNIQGTHLIYYPMVAALSVAFGSSPVISALVALAAVVALITTMLVLIMAGARTIMAAANAGLLPAFIGKVNSKTKTPVNAIIIVTGLIAILSCFPSLAKDIVGTGAFCKLVTIVMMVAALLIARKKVAYKPGQYRMPGGSVLPILVTALITIFISLQSFRYIIMAGVWFAIGLIIYGVSVATKKSRQDS